MVDLKINLSANQFKNPVFAASGAFGYGQEFAKLYDINILGSFSFKGTTVSPRFGNDTPRVAETQSGMLNAVGLQNPGIDEVINTEIPRISTYFYDKVIANVSGFSIDDYVECCKKLNDVDRVGIIEINISCPNIKHGGMSFGTTEAGAAEVTRAVKKATSKPVYIKLTPNVTDITQIALACESEGADGICLINTLLGMRIDINRAKAVLNNTFGGLSGPAIFPIALRMVWQVYNSVKIPIIGMGGIASASDVIEMMMAGAQAVQIGAAALKDPFIFKTIIEELPKLCEKLNITAITDIVGKAHHK